MLSNVIPKIKNTKLPVRDFNEKVWKFLGGRGLYLVVVHQAALISCDLASAEIAYTKQSYSTIPE